MERLCGMLICLLCIVSFGDAQAVRLRAGEESTFAIPRMSNPPTLDGTIEADEWREAVAISGTVDVGSDLLDPRPATFFLAWDADHLYMAVRAWMPAGYRPRLGGGRVPGGADCFDDGLELLVKPLGQNVSDQNHRTEFKFNISCLGHGGTYTRLAVGQIMSNWEPNFRSAARVTQPGTAPGGGKWWELEVAFSTDDFELVGENRAGDEWVLMLGINHLPSVGWMQARIPCLGGYFTPDGKSRGRLVENTPAVQMTMDSLSNLAADGTATVDIKAYNPSDAPVSLDVTVDVAGKLARTEILELPPKGMSSFHLDEKLPDDVKRGRMVLTVMQGDDTLLSCVTPFQVGLHRNRIQEIPDPDPNQFPFSVKFNPVRGMLEVFGDSYMLPDPDAVRALVYEIVDTDGAALVSGAITGVHAWYYREILELPDIPYGDYQATGHFELKDGTTFGPRSGRFTRKNEAEAFAHWWGKDFGNTERVLAPFEAIRRLDTPDLPGATFTCWGREYTVNALGLPVAVESQDAAVMASAARIVVTVNGQEIVIPAGEPTITEQKEWRVRFSGEAEGAGLTFKTEGWMEQDGMVSVDLTYGSKDGAPVQVDALRIEYPIANEVAECLASVGPGMNFAAMTATVLPTDKQGRLWTVFDTGRAGAQMTVGSFYPHVWLGNELRGFQWWADSDRGWFPDDDVPAHEIAREGGAVVLKNNIIGKTVGVGEPRTLNFTWMASPFKPLPKGWRMISATDNGTFFQPFRGVRVNPRTGQKYWDPARGNINWIHPESDDPEEWAELWEDQRTKGTGWGMGADEIVRTRRPFDLYQARTGVSWQHMSFQLIGYGVKSMEQHLYDYFGDEWFPGGYDTWNESYVDYAMYLFDRAFGEGGVVSTYWDLAFPIATRSVLSGLAYQLPDGRVQPGYNSMNCRRFHQRLWAVQDKHGLNPGSVGHHSTQAYLFPALPWIDAVLDGERDWNLDVTDMDWIDYYPKDRMRAMSVPHNWGVGICWMSNFHTVDPAKRLEAKTSHAEYVWIHDSWLNPYLEPGPIVMPHSILDWGLNAEAVTYHPYWRAPYTEYDDPDILVSVWRLPAENRALIGIFNYNTDDDRDARIHVSLDGLGLPPETVIARTLYNAVDAGIILHSDTGSLVIDNLLSHRGVFIGLAAPEPGEIARAQRHIPDWVAGGLPDAVIDQGFVRAETEIHAAPRAPGVTCDDAAIHVGMWQLPDRIMLLVYNSNDAGAKDAVLAVDLDALNLTPELPWQDFIRVRNLYSEQGAPGAALDYYGRKLTLRAIPARTGRLVAIRRY